MLCFFNFYEKSKNKRYTAWEIDKIYFKENMKFNTKEELLSFYNLEVSKLNENKLYILHIKLNLKGLRGILNPYAFLIQAAAFVNQDYQINHTALIYGIYKDKALGKSAKYVEATLFGLSVHSFWYLVSKVHANGGEIWIEEVPDLTLDSKLRKWLGNFVEKRLIEDKYNILKAIGSQSFKSKFLMPLNFFFNLIGKVGKSHEGYFCTEIVKIILDEVRKKITTKQTLKQKQLIDMKPEKLYPAEFFGKTGTPRRFI